MLPPSSATAKRLLARNTGTQPQPGRGHGFTGKELRRRPHSGLCQGHPVTVFAYNSIDHCSVGISSSSSGAALEHSRQESYLEPQPQVASRRSQFYLPNFSYINSMCLSFSVLKQKEKKKGCEGVNGQCIKHVYPQERHKQLMIKC